MPRVRLASWLGGAGLIGGRSMPQTCDIASPTTEPTSHESNYVPARAQEFAAAHAAGAVNVPLDELTAGVGRGDLPSPDTCVCVICQSGRRSAQARASSSRHRWAPFPRLPRRSCSKPCAGHPWRELLIKEIRIKSGLRPGAAPVQLWLQACWASFRQ